MSLSKKICRYSVLSILAVVVAITSPSLVNAAIPNLQFTIKVAQSQTTNIDSDEAHIKQSILLNEQKHHWRPQVKILAIADGYAIASVHDQNTGGQSLLKKEQGNWVVVCGTGGGFGLAAELVHHCSVPERTANRLLEIKAAHRRQLGSR